MIKRIFTYYKLPLLISLTLTIILLALGVVRGSWNIIEVVLGCFLGTFVLDTEYIMYAYIFEPNSEFAKSIFGYIKHKDIKNLIAFINQHKDDVKEKSLNSVLFQAILVPISIFVVFSQASFYIKAFVLSVFANSIYRLIEAYFEEKTNDWFWAIKGNPKKEGVIAFIIFLILVLVFCFYSF